MYSPGSYRARQPQSVVREIQSAYERYGPFGSVYFDDDTFNIGRKRMLEFAEAMRNRPAKIPWGCNTRADLFDDEILSRLAEAGLFNVRVGIESGDPEVLSRARKDINLESVRRCIDIGHRVGVKVHVSYTIGLSGESWKSVERTVAFAKSITPDSAAFTITTPYPVLR
jgi:radical SAM superfamily enzyme YgiQ (UPF0313 family)